jgi:DNA mismatch repair protein MSH6
VPTFGVCILDAATAEFRLTHFDDDASRTRLETLLRSLRIKELMHEKAGLSQRTMRVLRNTVPLSCQTTMLKAGSEFLDLHGARRKLDALFAPGEETTEASVFPAAIQKMLDKPAAMSALGGMLWYLEQLNLDADLVSSRNFDVFDPLRQDACLVLDAQSLTHLNVLSNEQGDDEGTLHRLLNRCITPFGKRLFKIWLVAPLAARAPLEARHDAVDAFLTNPTFEDEFDGFARSLPDIERIMPRIYAGKCKPADFTRTLKALTRIDPAVERLLELAHDFATPVVGDLLRSIPAVAKRSSRLQSMFTVQEDGAFSPRRNVHQDYDAADDAIAKIERDLENELAKAAKAVGLEKRQVKWKHIGTKEIYQVEVPIKTRVPNDWALMSQVKDYKRYYSPAVRDLVQQLKEARETRLAALKEFHAQLFVEFSDDGPLFLRAVKGLAELDCLLSLAKASYAMGEPTCRPEFVDCETALVDFEELRHPCMATASGADFIANNVALGGEHDEVVILTGGNMAGKSTTARTTATAVILAQMGCRVPATRARISPVDRIASRMGANDQVSSTNGTCERPT